MTDIELNEFENLKEYCYKIRLTFKNNKSAVYVYGSDKQLAYEALTELMNDRLGTTIFYTVKDGRAVAVAMIEVVSAEIIPWGRRR